MGCAVFVWQIMNFRLTIKNILANDRNGDMPYIVLITITVKRRKHCIIKLNYRNVNVRVWLKGLCSKWIKAFVAKENKIHQLNSSVKLIAFFNTNPIGLAFHINSNRNMRLKTFQLKICRTEATKPEYNWTTEEWKKA